MSKVLQVDQGPYFVKFIFFFLGECIGDIMSNWQVFQNWSSENEKLAYLLLSFRPEKYEKSFRQLLKCLRRKNSPEDNTKEVNVVYVRLLAAYLEAKVIISSILFWGVLR